MSTASSKSKARPPLSMEDGLEQHTEKMEAHKRTLHAILDDYTKKLVECCGVKLTKLEQTKLVEMLDARTLAVTRILAELGEKEKEMSRLITQTAQIRVDKTDALAHATYFATVDQHGSKVIHTYTNKGMMISNQGEMKQMNCAISLSPFCRDPQVQPGVEKAPVYKTTSNPTPQPAESVVKDEM